MLVRMNSIAIPAKPLDLGRLLELLAAA